MPDASSLSNLPRFLEQDPDDFEMDLLANGIAALDWVAGGHEVAVERVELAWRHYREQLGLLRSRTRGRAGDADVAVVRAAGLQEMEAAARSYP
ncbi:hypothetical protein G5T42_13835 [Microbacterium sp. 4R-513]|uniref:hypothetical protein n=1 Tax=Microbacterium sp. 4R-513 TaxID=2567934 RepID=UPI0013E11CA7|nr:hypothetical protein [Microbacterium sp. 4R-513]QIG40421.1 hypothetical protein G5T42_13835 [Microbacterium sp. 4R-513]